MSYVCPVALDKWLTLSEIPFPPLENVNDSIYHTWFFDYQI